MLQNAICEGVLMSYLFKYWRLRRGTHNPDHPSSGLRSWWSWCVWLCRTGSQEKKGWLEVEGEGCQEWWESLTYCPASQLLFTLTWLPSTPDLQAPQPKGGQRFLYWSIPFPSKISPFTLICTFNSNFYPGMGKTDSRIPLDTKK